MARKNGIAFLVAMGCMTIQGHTRVATAAVSLASPMEQGSAGAFAAPTGPRTPRPTQTRTSTPTPTPNQTPTPTPGTTAWAKTYGGSGLDQGYAVQQTSDGGYIALGTQSSFGIGAKCLCSQVWLFKLDSGGNRQWQKTYPGTGTDGYPVQSGYSLQQTADGGYVLGGFIRTDKDANGDWQAWVLKVNSRGNLQWQYSYGFGPGSAVYGQVAIRQTSDLGYVMAGTVTAPLPEAAFVLRLNADGSLKWAKTFAPANTSYSSAYSVWETTDGGCVVAGNSYYGSTGAWLFKLDSAGNSVWQKLYGPTSYGGDIYYGYSVQQTTDGGYIVTGETGPYSYEYAPNGFFAIRLDSIGNVVWQKKYGGYSFASGKSVRQTTDGGFVFAGWIIYYYGYGAWIIKTDPNGDIQWQKVYGDDTEVTSSVANAIRETADGGYAVAGWTSEYGAGSYDLWVLKLDSTGSIPGCSENGASSNATVTNLSLTVSNVVANPARSVIAKATAATAMATGAAIGIECAGQ